MCIVKGLFMMFLVFELYQVISDNLKLDSEQGKWIYAVLVCITQEWFSESENFKCAPKRG